MNLQRIKEIVDAVPEPMAIKAGTEQAFLIRELYQIAGKKLNWGEYCLCNADDYIRRSKNMLNASN